MVLKSAVDKKILHCTLYTIIFLGLKLKCNKFNINVITFGGQSNSGELKTSTGEFEDDTVCQ